MAKKNVLMVCAVFYPEPIVSARLMTDLAGELAKKYNVTVIRPRPSRPMGFKMPDYNYDNFTFKVIEVDSYIHPASSFIGRYKENRSFAKVAMEYIEINHESIDFLFNSPWQLFGVNWLAHKAVKYGIPYITPVQDLYPESMISKLPNITILHKLVTKLLLPLDIYNHKHAARVYTNSIKMLNDLVSSRHIPESKYMVVRNWQNEKEFTDYAEKHEGEKRCEGPFTFMYLGNVGPLAGVDTLFEALKLANLPDARLVIAGSGSAKAGLMEKAKEYTGCNIEFWEVPAGMVPSTQAKADVMCLPVMKGFALSSVPSKLPAYMFSAKPVLAAVDKESDSAQCIRLSGGGWVAEPENPSSISEYMLKAYNTDQKQLTEMGNKAFDYSISTFSRKINLPILTNACIEIIEKN